jgi:integrase
MQAKLLVSTVRVLTQQVPPAKETTIFDTVVPRFALRVRPKVAGRQTWPSLYFIRYVGPDGRERKFKIGSPATMNLETARHEARAKLAIVDRGGDPVVTKAALRERWNVERAVEAYIGSDEFHRKTPKGQATESATLRLHVVHRLGNLPLADLDLPRIRALVRAIEKDTRTNARGRRLGGLGAARKTARLLSTMLGWCIVAGRLSTNPLLGAMRSLRLAPESPRETVITEPQQYAQLFETMDAMLAGGVLRAFSRAFIIVAALTGMRRSELQTLHWGQVDLGAGRITLTTSKGAKLARGGLRTETVSLPPFAAAALAAIRSEDAQDDEQVFIPRRGNRLEINRDWVKVRDRAGLPADLALHGLRHSAGTVAVMSGLSGPEVQKMLRHRNISTTAKYIHLAETARLQDRALGHLAPLLPTTGTGGA